MLLWIASTALAALPQDELSLDNYSIVSLTPAIGGLEAEITADVVNPDTGDFAFTYAQIGDDVPTGFVVLDDRMDFGDVGPNATVAASDTVTIFVPYGNRAVFFGWIRNDPWEVLADELPNPPLLQFDLDEETDNASAGCTEAAGVTTCQFTSMTPLLDSLNPTDLIVWDGWLWPLYFDGGLPFEVTSVNDLGGTVEVVGIHHTDLADFYTDGTFRERIPVQLTDYFTLDPLEFESLTEECIFSSASQCEFHGLHVKFNDLEISPGVFASGVIAIDEMVFELLVRYRTGSLKRVGAEISVTASVDLEIRTETYAEVPPVEIPLFLYPLRLPGFAIPLGPVTVTIVPELELYAGASGEFYAESVTTYEQAATWTLELAMEDGVLLPVVPRIDPSPTRFTPPQIVDTTQATGRAWGAVEVDMVINEMGGPSMRIEPYVELGVDPAADPWWSLDAGTVWSGDLELSFAGVEVAQLNMVTVDEPLHVTLDQAGPGAAVEPVNEDQRWSRLFLENIDDEAFSLRRLPGAGAVFSGGQAANTYPSTVTHVDTHGDWVWSTQIDYTVSRVAVDPTGALLVGGSTNYANGDAWVGGLDAIDGSLDWSMDLDLPDNVEINALEVGDDGFVLGGYTTPAGLPVSAVVLRLEPDGTVRWAKQLQTDSVAKIFDIAVEPSGHVWVVGTSEQDVGTFLNPNGWIARLDPNGALLWSRQLASTELVEVLGIDVDTHGMAVIGGQVKQQYTHISYDSLFFATIDDSGAMSTPFTIAEHLLWEDDTHALVGDEWGDGVDDAARSVAWTPDGHALIGGVNSPSGTADHNAWLMRVDPTSGRFDWMATVDGTARDSIDHVAWDGDGILALGHSQSFDVDGLGTGHNELWISRFPRTGVLTLDPSLNAVTRLTQPRIRSFPVLHEDLITPLSDWHADITADTVVSDIVGIVETPGVRTWSAISPTQLDLEW